MADTLEPVGADAADLSSPNDASETEVADEGAETLASNRPVTSPSFGLSRMRADAGVQAREQKMNTRRRRVEARQERVQARIAQAAQFTAPTPATELAEDDQAPTLMAADTAETIQASRQVAYTEPDAEAATLAGNRTVATQPPAAPIAAVPSAPNTIGRFQLTRKLAQGGMGAVFEARDPLLARRVAIKRVRIDRVDSLTLARFEREIRLSAELTHPGICAVYEGGRDDKGPYFVMRFLDGKPLNKWAREDSPSLEQRLVLFEKVCQALSHAHQAGWLHRDLKPDNIVVTTDGTAQVVDWGIARPIGAPADQSDQPGNSIIDIADVEQQAANPALTTQGAVIGTPAYMSPEQADGEVQGLTNKSDVYALGAVLYYLAVGKPPILADGKTALQIVMEARQAKMEPLPDSVPAPLRAIILKAMQRSPRRRYRSADELRRDVVAFRMGEPGLAWTDGFFTRMRRNWARHAAGYSLLLTAILVVVLVGAVAVAVLTGLDHARVLREQEQQRSEQAAADAEVAVLAEREAQKRKADAIVRQVSLEPQIEKVKADMKYTFRSMFSVYDISDDWGDGEQARFVIPDADWYGGYGKSIAALYATILQMDVIEGMNEKDCFALFAIADQADRSAAYQGLAAMADEMSIVKLDKAVQAFDFSPAVDRSAIPSLVELMKTAAAKKVQSRKDLLDSGRTLMGIRWRLQFAGFLADAYSPLENWLNAIDREDAEWLTRNGLPVASMQARAKWVAASK